MNLMKNMILELFQIPQPGGFWGVYSRADKSHAHYFTYTLLIYTLYKHIF